MKKIEIKNIANFLYLMDIFVDFKFYQKLNKTKYLSS